MASSMLHLSSASLPQGLEAQSSSTSPQIASSRRRVVKASSFNGFAGSSQKLRLKANGVKSRSKATAARGQKHLSVQASAAPPLKVIISGAPASGKGTQCELIVEKFGLVHISAGDLLRAEVKDGTPNGTVAKSYMDAGQLVPDEVVINIVKDRLGRPDAQEKGWLLDGFPRSASQGNSLVADGIIPDVFVLLNVPDEVIVERVVGRRMDPETGKIYHLKFSPPPNDPAVIDRLVQRSDDTEEKCQARLDTHARNVDSVLSLYEGKISPIDGNRNKDLIYQEIADILTSVQQQKEKAVASSA